jgi:hypothetical protein
MKRYVSSLQHFSVASLYADPGIYRFLTLFLTS